MRRLDFDMDYFGGMPSTTFGTSDSWENRMRERQEREDTGGEAVIKPTYIPRLEDNPFDRPDSWANQMKARQAREDAGGKPIIVSDINPRTGERFDLPNTDDKSKNKKLIMILAISGAIIVGTSVFFILRKK